MPRPSKYISRADLGWGPSPAGYANPTSGLVVHYVSVDQDLADQGLEAAIRYWRNTRAFHTGPQRNWGDIGYSFMAAHTGHILEGRGLYRVQAAQPGGNSTHYSVTLATGPNDRITPSRSTLARDGGPYRGGGDPATPARRLPARRGSGRGGNGQRGGGAAEADRGAPVRR